MSCGNDGRTALWTAESLRKGNETFSDTEHRGSGGSAILELPDGDLAVLASLMQVTSVALEGERSVEAALRHSEELGTVSFSTHERTENLVIRVDKIWKRQETVMIGAGSDVYSRGGLADIQGNIWLVGSLGGQAALLDLGPAR
jgi:hypothetical protein